MKGVVFTEFLEMVETAYSPDLADDIIESSDLPSGGVYTAVGTYDAAEMTALVGSLSERVDMPVPDLLRAYGRFLFGRFGEMYPGFFTGDGDVLDFLAGIERVIHSEVHKLYPDAELPRFTVTRPTSDQLVMVYRSPRRLGDLAEGLISGAVAHFDEPCQVTRHEEPDDPTVVTFTIVRNPR